MCNGTDTIKIFIVIYKLLGVVFLLHLTFHVSGNHLHEDLQIHKSEQRLLCSFKGMSIQTVWMFFFF